MVSKPILELNPITPPLTGNEQVPLVQGGATKRASVNDWAAAMAPFFPSPNVQILGGDSIAGGGAITQSQVLTLVNDLANPGTSMFYGTNGAGTRGWYALTFGGTVTSIDTGSGLTGGPITVSGTISVATNGITNALFRQSAALSVVGRDSSTSGNVADIIATTDGDVLQVSGATLVFKALSATTISGIVPSSRQVIAGTGLTGGGALTSDVTLNIGSTISGAGPIGSATSVPVITFNDQGQLTAVSAATISVSGLNGLEDPGANGIVVRTTSNVTTARTLTGSANISVTNGDGVSGNPAVSISGIIGLSLGGTGANLTAENGAVYSTSTAFAILPSVSSAILGTTSGNTPAYISVLAPGNGGTGTAFFGVSGLNTSVKVFVFPNVSDTVAVLGQAQTFTAPQRGTVSGVTVSGIDIIPNFAMANNFSVTVSGTMRLQNPTNVSGGQSGMIEFVTVSGGTAQMTVSGTSWYFPGTKPTISSGSGVVNALAYYVGASTTRVIGNMLTNLSN
ncbi:MAG: hypothetical protein E6Q97_31815 [Desulfurellales bacterium]|nr:MAG: hypothetical protein E6Q97_31815 [Desulfurellales bacterium]